MFEFTCSTPRNKIAAVFAFPVGIDLLRAIERHNGLTCAFSSTGVADAIGEGTVVEALSVLTVLSCV